MASLEHQRPVGKWAAVFFVYGNPQCRAEIQWKSTKRGENHQHLTDDRRDVFDYSR
jgi:hypothetical protein